MVSITYSITKIQPAGAPNVSSDLDLDLAQAVVGISASNLQEIPPSMVL